MSTSPKACTRPGLLPERNRRQGGHEQFDGPGGVHFLADDPLGLAQRTQAQGQIGIGPGHHLVDQPGAEHEDVAGDFRPFGRFLHRGNERVGPKHGSDGGQGSGNFDACGFARRASRKEAF